MYAATSASSAAASIRRAPSRTSSSINDPPTTAGTGAVPGVAAGVVAGVPSSGLTTVNTAYLPDPRWRAGTLDSLDYGLAGRVRLPALIHRIRALLPFARSRDARRRTRLTGRGLHTLLAASHQCAPANTPRTRSGGAPRPLAALPRRLAASRPASPRCHRRPRRRAVHRPQRHPTASPLPKPDDPHPRRRARHDHPRASLAAEHGGGVPIAFDRESPGLPSLAQIRTYATNLRQAAAPARRSSRSGRTPTGSRAHGQISRPTRTPASPGG